MSEAGRTGVIHALTTIPPGYHPYPFSSPLDTTAESILLFHLDGALCAAQGNYTNALSTIMITGFKYAFLSRNTTSRKTWEPPKLAFAQETHYSLFYGAAGQQHVLVLVFSHSFPLALVKKLLSQAVPQLEPLLKRP